MAGGELQSGRVFLSQADVELARRRAALTLFELLLVLALLIVVSSLAAPLFEGSFSSIRLRRGTDQLLAAWSEARTHAIESGKIYQFRFKPEKRDYRVDPWSGGLEPESEETGNLVVDTVDTDQLTDEESRIADWKSEAQLPEQIVFNAGERVIEDALGQRNLTRLDQDGVDDWSTPIFFYPDGTTSEASLLLKNNNGLYRRATLRSLTGVGRASEPLTREELDQLKSF